MRGLVLILFAWLSSPSVLAHEMAPALLEFRLGGQAPIEVLWRRPRSAEAVGIALRFPSGCQVEWQQHQPQLKSLESRGVLSCPGGKPVGQSLAVQRLAQSGSPALLRWIAADDSRIERLLSASAPATSWPQAPSKLETFVEYLQLGIEHILIGADHLLFVLGLLLIAASARQLLIAVTAFTVGHSLTLALVSLNLLQPPSALVEWLIAVSILTLALELSRQRPGWISLHAWPVTLGFGLVHGMGFAGVLGGLGLAQGQLLLSLFSFNLGIEIGQLAFVGLLCLLWWGLRAVPNVRPAVRMAAIYLLGSVSVFWCLERGLPALNVA